MKQEEMCPELRELAQLVAEARPDIGTDFHNYLAELLWGMLATTMRETVAPEGKKLADLIEPFEGYFIFSQAFTSSEDFKILEKFLFGKNRELPYGTIAVDSNGVVTLIKVKPPPDPKDDFL